MNVYSSSVHNQQKHEITQMSFSQVQYFHIAEYYAVVESSEPLVESTPGMKLYGTALSDRGQFPVTV